MKINISLVDHYNQLDSYVKCPLPLEIELVTFSLLNEFVFTEEEEDFFF